MSNNLINSSYKEGWIFEDLYVFIDNNILNNSYVLIKNQSALVIDPSFNSQKIINFLNKNKLNLDGILITHGHYDHVGETNIILEHFDTKFYLQENDAKICTQTKSNLFKKIENTMTKKIVTFNKSLPLIKNWEEFKVLHTPGHTPGSSCYYNKKYVFTGDHIFDVDIGRTDFEFSDDKLMQMSLKSFVNEFKNKNMFIFPGHEEWNQVDNLKNINKYVSKYF